MDALLAKEFLNELLIIVNSQILYMLLYAIIFVVICMLIKYVGECITAKIQIILDDSIGINTPVELKGKRGVIRKITWVKVIVETKEGFLTIPITSWKNSGYLILKPHIYDWKEEKQ